MKFEEFQSGLSQAIDQIEKPIVYHNTMAFGHGIRTVRSGIRYDLYRNKYRCATAPSAKTAIAWAIAERYGKVHIAIKIEQLCRRLEYIEFDIELYQRRRHFDLELSVAKLDEALHVRRGIVHELFVAAKYMQPFFAKVLTDHHNHVEKSSQLS